MNKSAPVDGFALAYDRHASVPASSPRRPAVLLHGWPGDRTDYRLVVPLLHDGIDVIVPDLRGFGDSDRHQADPDAHYNAAAQATSIAALIEELGLVQPIVAGYDIGSRIAQKLADDRPELVGGLVLSPPLPGAGRRVLDPEVEPELWYQGFHRSGVAATLLDGDVGRVRAYLTHFWDHWSGPDFRIAQPDIDHLVRQYARPGAFTSSIAWYGTGRGYVANALAEEAPAKRDRVAAPTEILWQEFDPLFPRDWADRVHDFFGDARLHWADGVGHFTPVEAPQMFANLIDQATQKR